MAHICPRCGAICTCHGDTINIVLDTPEDRAICEHCTALEQLVEENPEAFDDDDGEAEP